MSDEDDSLIRLTGPGWEALPDGSFQFLVTCPNLVSYVCLPKSLRIGDTVVLKSGWNSDRKLAHYRTARIDLTFNDDNGKLSGTNQDQS